MSTTMQPNPILPARTSSSLRGSPSSMLCAPLGLGEAFQHARASHLLVHEKCISLLSILQSCRASLQDEAVMFTRPHTRKLLSRRIEPLYKEVAKLFAQGAALLEEGEEALDEDDGEGVQKAMAAMRAFAAAHREHLRHLSRQTDEANRMVRADQKHHSEQALTVLPNIPSMPNVSFNHTERQDLFCVITQCGLNDIDVALAIQVGATHHVFCAEALENYLKSNLQALTQDGRFYNPLACRMMPMQELRRVVSEPVTLQKFKQGCARSLARIKHALAGLGGA